MKSYNRISIILIMAGVLGGFSFSNLEKVRNNFVSNFTLDRALACTYDEFINGE